MKRQVIIEDLREKYLHRHYAKGILLVQANFRQGIRQEIHICHVDDTLHLLVMTSQMQKLMDVPSIYDTLRPALSHMLSLERFRHRVRFTPKTLSECDGACVMPKTE